MGVMTCNRRDCENIMCERHSCEYGYICDECFDELVRTGPTTDISVFMNSCHERDREIESIERYNGAFPIE